MKYWSKSALSIYRYLESMSNTLDKIIVNTGKSSNSSELQKYQSTYFQANKIIELMDRKRKMINLKVSIEESLSHISRDSRRILVLCFVDGITSEMISQLFGISLRTFFRKKINAINEFSNMLSALGYDSDYFEAEYSNERWLMGIYEESLSKLNTDEDVLDNALVKRMFNEVSKVNLAYNTYI